MKDYTLLQIANGLSANVQKLKSPGLLEGKTGVTVFLCHYARYSGQTAYEHLVEHLIDEISDTVSKLQKNISLSIGLSGIGWGVKHLLRERLLESNDELLEDFDNIMINCIQAQTNENMLDSCLYLACCRPELLDDTLASVLARHVSCFMSSGSHPLAVLNKVQALAIRTPHRYLHPWSDRLPDAAIRAIDTRLYRHSDIMLCKDLLEAFTGKDENKSWDMLHDRCTSLLTAGNLPADRMEAVWQCLMFLDGTCKEACDPDWISMMVTDMLKDLKVEDLYLSSGLSAMGMDMLLT